MRYYKVVVLIFALFLTLSGFGQNHFHDLKWEAKPKSAMILRPLNIPNHAYLFERDQVEFKVCYWIEWNGKIDNVNDIFKLRIYQEDGYNFSDKFYFLLKSDVGFEVDTNDYKVDNAVSPIITVSSKGKSAQLCEFNHLESNYEAHIKCVAADKEKYKTVAAYEDNPYNYKYCSLTKTRDVCIKIAERNASQYQVTIQNEIGKLTTANYVLKSKQKQDVTLSEPFRIKYYHKNTGRIYLINKDWWLEKIN